jgi:UDP-glucose 4-epimerase
MVGSTVMVNALIDMLLLSKEHNVKRFVYISSSMVYGDFQCGVREDGECAPQGFYAIMKYSGELLVKDFCLSNGIEYVIVRPSAVYGPMDVEDRVVSKFLLNAIRNEPLVVKGADEILDFSYITDTARGIALASTVSAAANQTYNITRGCGHTLLEAAQLAIKVTKSKSEIIILDKDKTFPSRGSLGISKAMDELGYLPEINIEEGFQLYAEWLNNSIYRTGSPV